MSRRDRTMWLSPALLLLGLPGCLSIRGPESVRGLERGSLTVRCRYDPGWEANSKWWCRGQFWSLCEILVQTTQSARERVEGRVSIRDNQKDRLITVTMKELKRDDQDTYWCGISRVGTDRGVSVKVIIVPEGTVLPTAENLLSGTTNSHRNMSSGPSSGSHIRTHYVLLVFVKVPILLILVGAVLWLKEPQSDPKEHLEQPIYKNLSSDLTKDTIP
ncbi:CMRF35-like molecule 7 [Pteropus vampyrus]|uniref:CMRF35-like molecule 7 n=1 Tax=Pteropus vampyrus TaxID=132908 RepID=A0A6P3Q755_PTEVA|nr:CMRF35-like molecule 7 [Pteropus vampyrus]